MKKSMRWSRIIAMCAVAALTMVAVLGCGDNDGTARADRVVIATNADEEAVAAMSAALDANGFSGQYTFQEFGTAELGGRLMAEGTNIEADIITLASFYIESSQARDNTFVVPLDVGKETLQDFPDYMAPILAITGSIFVNTELMEQDGLPMPTSIKDLADPVYAGNLSIADINSSSTAWLFTQALIDNYGEAEAEEILTGIYSNAGDQVLASGSGPIRAVRAGEVAVGFGLRHTAVADHVSGLPIDFIDPVEGNYQLVEALSVVDKGDDTNPLAMEMAQTIVAHAREALQADYPMALYVGEVTDADHQPADPRVYPQPLTLELLEQHQAIVDRAARAAN
ncbi:MAG: extracellular solute-binding protein [Coriobacteriia bacterium]|nr:extracellular solute-binding protein [Coriobacteriia bacterium]